MKSAAAPQAGPASAQPLGAEGARLMRLATYASGAVAGAGLVCAPALCGHITAIRVIARNSLDHFISVRS